MESTSIYNLPERIGARPMATAKSSTCARSLREHGKPQVFSDELLEAIRETHERARAIDHPSKPSRLFKFRALSFMRRNDSVSELRRDIDLPSQRTSDDLSLLQSSRSALRAACPACEKKYIYYVGEGTEQLEEMLEGTVSLLFASRASIVTRRRAADDFEKSLSDFSDGRIDMLVGTQMLAKGHDFPNVTLVGVVSVDAGLALPISALLRGLFN